MLNKKQREGVVGVMEENKEILLTQEGYQKLEDEVEHLKSVRRREVAERIKVAISFGDISENAEYDEAKNEQAQVEERIIKLENMLRKAVIIDESKIDSNIVTIGSIVKVNDMEFEEEVEYTIVGSAEADPYEGKISNESPVGKALLGRAKGEVVDVQVPDGVAKFEILEIRR
ncbi:transcription elongation factor GreA [[Clostridium] sordellii]|uniref:Transcription elongation factor GreA n=2 Tax=Paraclostridium sordellii TaxID=1505 RepID=A0A9P1PBX5_PARSO|nr:transcription elongation factor GreA [Paeniclostridium sordellii]CEJ75218.1 Transcription elongation factor greA (Transcript cleavage factor GreA) [[Clostridium] sordellii] [Paeniclostridium sordellii]CEK32516.1 transcription elongation factor GreA [[Clostridium] sordellii] [Paeniclostridium sordellii]CEK36271.1 transcription elongation factor GreA,Transcript cleavage factor greA,transcription elongation factor GreA,Transcription elongation factor,transcription elongation factor GreA,Transcri